MAKQSHAEDKVAATHLAAEEKTRFLDTPFAALDTVQRAGHVLIPSHVYRHPAALVA